MAIQMNRAQSDSRGIALPRLCLVLWLMANGSLFAADEVSESESPTAASSATLHSELAPPLGLGDVADLLGEADLCLADRATSPRARVAIEMAERYIAHVAEVRAGEVRYDWYSLGRKRFEPGDALTRRFRPSEPVDGVMAIQMRPRGSSGRIYVKRVSLHSSSGDERFYHIERWIERDLPRREILYLDEPCDVAVVAIAARHDDVEPRPLYLSVGVPVSSDYPREIAGQCRLTLRALDAGDFGKARARVRRAGARLEAFRASLEALLPEE